MNVNSFLTGIVRFRLTFGGMLITTGIVYGFEIRPEKRDLMPYLKKRLTVFTVQSGTIP